MQRRDFLGAFGLAGAASLLGSTSLPGAAAGSDYRALVIVFLLGGNDGHNCLVPTDGAYASYQNARANLALLKNSLVTLKGQAAGHTFGMHPSLAPLATLYNDGRLGWIANVGPLMEPATAQQVIDGAVDVPPFLLSHSDQVAIQQGWLVEDDMSGWAGRGLELLPSVLRNPVAAVTMSTDRTLLLGRNSGVAYLDRNGSRYWGFSDLAQPGTMGTQSINRMARWQFANAYEAEYARTFGAAVDDAARFTRAMVNAPLPAADFGSNYFAEQLRTIATALPRLKEQGLRRQVFLTNYGGFDTHANQRGNGENTQDTLLKDVAKAVAAFDQTMRTNGMNDEVLTLMMTDFGRTVRPGSGGGSEHAWGNHWFALGGPVQGGTVHGQFPSAVLGGPDDSDLGKNGRHVPTTSTDQVGATVMRWLGLPDNLLHEVFPHLANFNQKTIPLLRA